MTSAPCNGASARTLFATRALAIWAIAAVAWALCLPGPLWAQTPQFTPNGANLVASPITTNVGIGTNTPGSKLEVNGGGTNSGILLYSGGSPNYTFLAIGRTSFEGMLGMAAAPGHFAPGSAAGDLIIRSEGKNILFTTDTGSTTQMYLKNGGNVGIGTTGPTYLLSVKGAIGAQEVNVVNTSAWPDYVFAPDYHLQPLNEVAAYVKEHHHLPEIPSEAEVKENGISLGDMQARLLAKIEELTLHLIQSDEKNRELQDRIARLESGRPPSTVAGPAGKETERP